MRNLLAMKRMRRTIMSEIILLSTPRVLVDRQMSQLSTLSTRRHILSGDATPLLCSCLRACTCTIETIKKQVIIKDAFG